MEPKYYFFWQTGTPLTNWHMQEFEHKDIKFNCSEQAMMYEKAMLFADFETADLILKAESPKDQKALGRKVKSFDESTWDRLKYKIVKDILRSKFTTIESNRDFLRSLKRTTIVESSPYDRVWGIGYRKEDAIDNIHNWGENLLGKILTELSNEL